MKDMFGQTVVESKFALPKKGRKPTPKRGYAAPPGTGPKGETCKTCKHIARVQHAKTYIKCGLQRAHWTGGPGTDILTKAPACRFWEKSA